MIPRSHWMATVRAILGRDCRSPVRSSRRRQRHASTWPVIEVLESRVQLEGVVNNVGAGNTSEFTSPDDLEAELRIDVREVSLTDSGQDLGSLFQILDPSGNVIAGAGFLGAYNTAARSDRRTLSVFLRDPYSSPGYEFERLPRPSDQIGAIAYVYDGRLFSFSPQDNIQRYWDEDRGWIEVEPRAVPTTVEGGYLTAVDGIVFYNDDPILDLRGQGLFVSTKFFFGNGTLAVHLYNATGSFNELRAYQWTPGSAVNPSAYRSLPLNGGEFVYTWGQLNNEILVGTNLGGFHVEGGSGWRTVRAPDGSSFQLYSSLNHRDSVLLGHYPSGRLYEYDGSELRLLEDAPPIPSNVSSLNREAQTLAVYGGEVLVGVWPWGEVWRQNADTGQWSLIGRMFTHPDPSTEIEHPYEDLAGTNDWGQRINSMVPLDGSLYITTSAKGEVPYTGQSFLADGKWEEYGAVIRASLPGQIDVPVDWIDDGTLDLTIGIGETTLTVYSGDRVLGEVEIPPHLRQLFLRSGTYKVAWADGVYGESPLVIDQAGVDWYSPPEPDVLDTFNRSNSDNLGSDWIEISGDLRIFDETVATYHSGASTAVANGLTASEVSVRTLVDVGVADLRQAGLIVRQQGPGERDLYLGLLKNDHGVYTAQIYRNLNGTYTLLAETTVDPAFRGHGTLQFDALGTTFTLSLDGEVLVTASDSAILSAGRVGIWGYNTVVFHDFSAVDSVSGSASAGNPFADNFDRGTGPVVGTQWIEFTGDHAIEDGKLASTANRESLAGLRGFTASNVSVQAIIDAGLGSVQSAGLVARHSGPGERNLYLGVLRNDDGQLYAEIHRNLNGAWTKLASSMVDDAGIGSLLRFDVIGNALSLYYAGRLVARATDSALASGGVGVWSYNDGVSFDNFIATTSIPPVPVAAAASLVDDFSRTGADLFDVRWWDDVGDHRIAGGEIVSSRNGASLTMTGELVAADVSLSATVDVGTTRYRQAGLVARHNGPGERNLYLGLLRNDGGVIYAQIYRNVNGVWTKLADTGIGDTNGSGTLRFDVVATTLYLYFDGRLVATAVDGTFTTGGVGLWSWNAGTRYDDFSAEIVIPSADAPPNVTLPYTDDFNRANGRFVGEEWYERLGNHDLQSGQLVSVAGRASTAILWDVDVADVSVSANVDVGTTGYRMAGLVARHSGPGERNLYLGLLKVDGGVHTVEIHRNLNGVWTRLAATGIGDSDGSGEFRFDVSGTTLNLYFRGRLVATATDSALVSGSVGVWSWNSGATYDDFAATTVIPPAPIPPDLPVVDDFDRVDAAFVGDAWFERLGNHDLVGGELVSNAERASLVVPWTKPATDVSVTARVDVGTTGYRLGGLVARQSGPGERNLYLGLLRTENGVLSAEIYRNVNGTWTRLAYARLGDGIGGGVLRFDAIGTTLSLYLDGLLVATADDATFTSGAVGVWSWSTGVRYDDFAASTTIPPVPPSPTLPVTDDFERADDELAGEDWFEPLGDHDVRGGELESTGTGASTVIARGISVADTSVEALVDVGTNGYRLGGLVARHSGPGERNAYVGFLRNDGGTLTAEVYRNLNGVWTALAVAAVSDDDGRGTLRFDVIGTTLDLYLDSTLVASVEDDVLTTGSVGLWSWGPGTKYDDFRTLPV